MQKQSVKSAGEDTLMRSDVFVAFTQYSLQLYLAMCGFEYGAEVAFTNAASSRKTQKQCYSYA
jgi:hypothetical protein